MIRIRYVMAILGLLVLASFKTDNPNAIVKEWITGKKDAKIEIFKQNEKYYGKIIWLKDSIDVKTGKPRLDYNNSDSKLKSKPAMGMLLLKDFIFKGEGRWEEGTVYDPENGEVYSCNITLLDDNRLEIRGYIGISIFGRTEIWVKAQK